MMHYFVYDGMDSRELGLLVSGEKTYNAPSRDITPITIPGRDGEVYIDNGRYNNVEIAYTVSFRNDMTSKTKALKAWLASKVGYRKLEDTYDPDYYRLAAYHNSIEFEVHVNRYATTELIFTCDPFKYLKQGDTVITLTANGSALYNPELFVSNPIIKIYGNGSATLTINNINYNISDISGYVTINSVTCNAYRDTINKNNTINFTEFPYLKAGKNAFHWSSGITKLEIIPRWCTL